jgi:hypothetical protein
MFAIFLFLLGVGYAAGLLDTKQTVQDTYFHSFNGLSKGAQNFCGPTGE